MAWTLRDVEKAVEAAHERGAKAAEVLVKRGTTTRVVRRERRNLTTEASDDSEISVRCWLDGGKVGHAVGVHWDSLDKLITKALKKAEKAAPDPFAGPVARLGAPSRGLGIDDRRHAQITSEDRIDVVVSNEAAAAKVDPRVRTGRFDYSDRREERMLANSKSVAMEASSTTYEASGVVLLRAPGGPYEFETRVAGRAFTATACLPFGAALAQRAAGLADDGPEVSGPMRVLLRSRPAARLMDWLAGKIFHKTPPFLKTGGQLFDRRIHLVDDGALPGGLRSYGFDDRGVLPVPLTVICEGVIDRRPIGIRAARQMQTRPTGHFRGDTYEPTNLQFHAGMRSVNAHLGEQTGLVFDIDDLPNLEKGVNPKTGEVDMVVHGIVWDRQQRLGPRRNVRLTGNLVNALSQVGAVASDTDRILHVDAPAFFMDGMQVDG